MKSEFPDQFCFSWADLASVVTDPRSAVRTNSVWAAGYGKTESTVSTNI